jgi:dTDP-L-rhamnose 4-epimerase
MPRQTPYAGVASIFLSALQLGHSPQVFEDGGQRRDFVHVSDVARANILALTSSQAIDGALNIGSGSPHTVLEFAEAMCEALPGAPSPIVTGQYRLGDVRHIVASTDLARERLGFRPRVEFTEGVADFATAPLRRARA